MSAQLALLCVSYLATPADVAMLQAAGEAHHIQVVQLEPSRPTQDQCPMLAGIAKRNAEKVYTDRGIMLFRPNLTPARADALLSSYAAFLGLE